jgi:hypothetical protein
MKGFDVVMLRILLILAAIVFSLGSLRVTEAQESRHSSPTWDVYFSPRGGATYAIRQALDNAKSVVLVQACSFASGPNHC